MVAFSSLQEQADFVGGKLRLKQEDISPEAWLMFVRAAAFKLPMNILQGLKTVRQILEHDGRVARKVSSPFPTLRLGNPDSGPVIPAIRKFLECGDRANFPYEWKTAPRHEEPAGFGLTDHVLDRINCEHLLLSRAGKLVLLRTQWLPKEKWADGYMETSPDAFWYELDHSSSMVFNMSEPSDAELVTWLSQRQENLVHPGLRAIYSMQIAMRDTVQHFEDWRRHAQFRHVGVDGIVFRVGG